MDLKPRQLSPHKSNITSEAIPDEKTGRNNFRGKLTSGALRSGRMSRAQNALLSCGMEISKLSMSDEM